jgi:hypothetical protein
MSETDTLNRPRPTAMDSTPSGNAKYALLRAVREVMGPAFAEKVQKKLDNAPNTRSGLEAALESCCKLVRLTVDEKKAKELELRCRSIIEKM